MESSLSSESSPQSKRHSFPAILSYSETLSVLSEHQRQYNDKEIVPGHSNVPILDPTVSEEERQQRLQHAVEWLKTELKDMYHQDKFLLRQFNHLNRTIQELKEKKELREEQEARDAEKIEEELITKQMKRGVEKEKSKVSCGVHVYGKNQLNGMLKNGELDLKPEKRSLNEYDSDYGSDQSMDRFEDDTFKDNIIITVSPKTTQKQRNTKRWTWWK